MQASDAALQQEVSRLQDQDSFQGDAEASLDFLSPAFDAHKALLTPGLHPPVPSAPPLDNVAKCRWLLPPDMPESLQGKEPLQGSQATKMKHQEIKEHALQTMKRIEQSCNISLQSVMSHIPDNSPLSILKEWHLTGQTVRVVTRHASGVRGVAHGQLVAYDKYMNVLMRDVKETYTVMVKVLKTKQSPQDSWTRDQQSNDTHNQKDSAVQGIGPGTNPDTSTPSPATGTPAGKSRWVRRQDHRQRTLGQVLIRGDTIVSINCVQPTGKERSR